MNTGPRNPSGPGGRNRRRRGRRPPNPRHAQGGQSGGPGGPRGGGPRGSGPRGGGRGRPAFSGPMDHAYRGALNGDNGKSGSGRGRGFTSSYPTPDPEPLPDSNSAPRIFAFVDDLFFAAKIQEVARKINVKVEFVKSDKDLSDKIEQNGDGKPSLIIFDLNNAAAKPLTLIPKLKSKLKKETSIIGFLSHLQGDLKLKAQEAGCDMVLPRSAFSQNLPQLLRRHGAPNDVEDTVQ